MILGVGLDVCEISRMEELLGHGHFMQRVMSPAEQAYIQSRGKNAAQTAAGLYAAKEALLKALGTGIFTLSLADIEITHDERGAPRFCPTGKAAQALRERNVARTHLSITHDGGVAAAVCILEGDGC